MISSASCFTLLLLACVAVEQVAPAPTYSTQLSPDLDTSAAYLQFFRVKQLIDDINIRSFREFWSAPDTPPAPGTGESVEAEAVVESVKKIEESVEDEPDEEEARDDTEVTEAVDAASEVDTAALPVLDLTEEAILSDSVGISLPAIPEVEEEDASVTTEATVNTEDGDGDVQVPVTVTTVAAITGPPDGDDSLNEVNTGNDEFHVSEETASAAKKYGYKILLKKVGSKEVPVGKIKYTIPTVVKTSSVEDEVSVEDSSDNEEVLEEDAEFMVSADEAMDGEDEIPPETGTEEPPVPVLDDIDVATESIPIIDVIAEVPIIEPSVTVAEDPGTQENEEETTTLLPTVDLPEPITAVIPELGCLDTASISEAVMRISEDMEAVAGIQSQTAVSCPH